MSNEALEQKIFEMITLVEEIENKFGIWVSVDFWEGKDETENAEYARRFWSLYQG